MNAKPFATKMKDEVEKAKSHGVTAIPCEKIIAYLDEILKTPESSSVDFKLHEQEQKHQHESNLEMFRSVVQTGLGAIKSAFILNGAAAFALLAFIGHLIQFGEGKLADFSRCLLFFSIGALVAALTSGFAYLCQKCYSNDSKWGPRLNNFCIALVFGSYLFFALGLFFTWYAFNAYG